MTFVCAMTLLLTSQVSGEGANERHDWDPVQRRYTNPSEQARQRPVRLVQHDEQANGRQVNARPDPIPIPPPQERVKQRSNSKRTTRGNVAAVVTSSLAIVLGLFFLVVWISRRAAPKASSSLPTEVLELMGAPLASRHNLQLLRLGRRLLLVSVTPDKAETLAEVTDPEEVNDLSALCRKNQPGSISATFRQVLHQLGSQPATAATRSKSRPRDSDLAVTGEREQR